MLLPNVFLMLIQYNKNCFLEINENALSEPPPFLYDIYTTFFYKNVL